MNISVASQHDRQQSQIYFEPFMQTFLGVRHVFLTNAWRTPKNVCFGGYSMQTSAKEIKKF